MTEEQARLIGESVHYYRKVAQGIEALAPGLEGWYGPWAATVIDQRKDGSQELLILEPGGRSRSDTCKLWDGKGERPREYWVHRNPLVVARYKDGV